MVEQNQFWDQLFGKLTVGIGVFDVTGATVCQRYLNESYYKMLGTRKEDRAQYLAAKTLGPVHPEDREGLYAEAQKAIRDQAPFRYRFRLLTGAGSYRWVEILANHETTVPGTERFYATYYDVDTLVRSQEALQAGHLLTQDALRSSDNVLFIYYPATKHYRLLAVPEYLRGMPQELDNYPEAFIQDVHMKEQDAASYREMVRRVEAGDPEAECTVQVSHQGKYTWYRVQLRAVRDTAGTLLRAIGNATNIDRFKSAENAFLEARTKLESLEEDMLTISCLDVTRDLYTSLEGEKVLPPVDAQYQVQLEPALRQRLAEEAFKMAPELAQQDERTVTPLLACGGNLPYAEDRRKLYQLANNANLKRLYANGQQELNFTLRERAGSRLLWVGIRLMLLQDPATGNLLALTYSRDINKEVYYKKLADQILNKNYERVLCLDLQSRILYRQKDLQGASLDFANEECEAALDAGLLANVAPEERETMRRLLQIPHLQAELQNKDVYTLYFKGADRVENLPGRPERRRKTDVYYLDEHRDVLVYLQSDVTAVYEEERQQRQRLAAAVTAAEQANEAKSEFVSRISHDIRTPIGIIKNMTDFAMADADNKEKLCHDLERIKSAGSFLLSLVNDVLDISKIDSGRIKLNPEPYPYDEHTENIKDILESMCKEKGLHYRYERRQKTTGIIVADKTRINQITLNLLSNAVKYTPAGGTVSYISDSEDLPDAKIRFGFEVRDTGIGMSEEFQRQMFKPFTQEYDNPQRPKGTTGTGLGLYIVKRMVDLMGGQLEVSSTPGQGTVVKCHLVCPDAARDPRYQTRLQPKQQQAAPAQLAGRVLLAEDNPVNTEIAKRILTSFGLTVDHAPDGSRAVEMFAAAAPGFYQAILMDIQMPKLNGYEATARIRSLEWTDAQTIPIIAMTADAFADARDRGLEAGMNAYLVKPLQPELLRQTLAKYLQG
jgi:signal transduction histidine kinase/ActR/RegA family two-component response regulator